MNPAGIQAAVHSKNNGSLLLVKANFFCRSVQDVGSYNLGDSVEVAGHRLFIMEKQLWAEGGVVRDRYVLGEERGFAAPFLHNEHLHGLCLTGTVLDTREEKIKLHFAIDKAQDKSMAFWFPYVPQQGNVMYCMPQLGTKAILKFCTENDDSGMVIHTCRTNGEECAETADYNKRYFTTEFGKRLAMLPDTLYYTGGSNLAELMDRKGALLETGKHLHIQAERHIRLHAKRRVTLYTPEHIYTTMPGSESVIDMAGREINALSPNTVLHSNATNPQPYPRTPSYRIGRKLARLVTGTVPCLAKPQKE